MSPISDPTRRSRLAATLALLAMVAQLWMGQIGVEHRANLLASGGAFSDICSAQDTTREGSSTDHRLRDAITCLASCTASASGSVVLLSGSYSHIGFAQAPQAPALHPEVQIDGRRRVALRPPAQAPPFAA